MTPENCGKLCIYNEIPRANTKNHIQRDTHKNMRDK